MFNFNSQSEFYDLVGSYQPVDIQVLVRKYISDTFESIGQFVDKKIEMLTFFEKLIKQNK